jgi:hypothetical protein
MPRRVMVRPLTVADWLETIDPDDYDPDPDLVTLARAVAFGSMGGYADEQDARYMAAQVLRRRLAHDDLSALRRALTVR